MPVDLTQIYVWMHLANRNMIAACMRALGDENEAPMKSKSRCCGPEHIPATGGMRS